MPATSAKVTRSPPGEQRRPEVEEDVLPPRQARLQRLRVDDDAGPGERTRERLGLGECGNLGCEAGGRARALVPFGLFEGALDRGSLRGDLGDVSGRDLTDEEWAVGHMDPCGCSRCARGRQVIDGEQCDGDRKPPAGAWPARPVSPTGRRCWLLRCHWPPLWFEAERAESARSPIGCANRADSMSAAARAAVLLPAPLQRSSVTD